MRLNKVNASEQMKSAILRAHAWASKHQQTLNGLPYDDQLASRNGIHLTLIVTNETSDQDLMSALKKGYAERDVVSHSVVVCPKEWLENAA